MRNWLKGWLDPVSGMILLFMALIILEQLGVLGHFVVSISAGVVALSSIIYLNRQAAKDREEGPYSKIARLESLVGELRGGGPSSLVPLNKAINRIERWLLTEGDFAPGEYIMTVELDERSSWLNIDVKRRPPIFVEEGRPEEVFFSIWKNTWAVHRCIGGEVQDPALFYLEKTTEDE
jgi:hypothetical protein